MQHNHFTHRRRFGMESINPFHFNRSLLLLHSPFLFLSAQEFNMSSMLGSFCLPNETIIDLHRVPYCPNSYNGQPNVDTSPSDLDSNNSNDDGTEKFRRISTESYVRQLRRDNSAAGESAADQFDYTDRKIIEQEFPKIEFDQCFVVTDKSLYLIEFK